MNPLLQSAACFEPFVSIKTLLAQDMQAVSAIIQQALHAKTPLVEQVSHHLIAGEGKRLRPMLALLSAGLFGKLEARHHSLASIVELIHVASLLHDDVVDTSSKRRGQDTANVLFGNSTSVLVGDFIYSRTFQMMVALGDMRVMEVLSEATNTIAQGEVLQLTYIRNLGMCEDDYYEIIYYKTAKLFEAAARLGAIINHASATEEEQLACYGKHIGLAFQLLDDVLDFGGNSQQMGKNQGDDLFEGKLTLPLLYALRHATPADAHILRQAVASGQGLDLVLPVLQRTSALEHVVQVAQQQVATACLSLEGISDSPYKRALLSLGEFTANRVA